MLGREIVNFLICYTMFFSRTVVEFLVETFSRIKGTLTTLNYNYINSIQKKIIITKINKDTFSV